MVIDLLHFARKLPSIPVQRRIDLHALVEARAACRPRPKWSAIFLKAYALVLDDFPELRRSYIKFPWPKLYELPIGSATIIVERDYHGEPALFSYLIKDPHQSLGDLSALIDHVRTAPVEQVKDFRRALRLASLPRPLRRLLWWMALNIGRGRGNYFGAFGVSVYSALNAESLHPLSPLTSLMNYGVIGDEGGVTVRVVYDHRVLDGARVARALNRLEEILNGPILEELRAMQSGRPQMVPPIASPEPATRAARA